MVISLEYGMDIPSGDFESLLWRMGSFIDDRHDDLPIISGVVFNSYVKRRDGM